MKGLELVKHPSLASEQAHQPQRKWFPVDALPEDIIEYPAVGLYGYLKGAEALSEHGWS